MDILKSVPSYISEELWQFSSNVELKNCTRNFQRDMGPKGPSQLWDVWIWILTNECEVVDCHRGHGVCDGLGGQGGSGH